jgi:hypothetical protein
MRLYTETLESPSRVQRLLIGEFDLEQ